MRAERGMSSIVMAVLTAVILFGLGLVMAMLSSHGLAAERRLEHSVRARYLAESGLALAYTALQRGETAVAVDRKLFSGRVMVRSHEGRDVATGRPCVDLLSQGLVRDEVVLLYARTVPDAPFFSRGAPVTDPSTTNRRIVVLRQVAVPSTALGRLDVASTTACGAGAHVLIETWYRERADEARSRYRRSLAPLGRKGVYEFCHRAIARLIGSPTPPS